MTTKRPGSFVQDGVSPSVKALEMADTFEQAREIYRLLVDDNE